MVNSLELEIGGCKSLGKGNRVQDSFLPRNAAMEAISKGLS